MKKFVLLAALIVPGIATIAQNVKTENRAQTISRHVYPTVGNPTHPTKSSKIPRDRRKDDIPTYFVETFSNGLDGENGEWTTGGAQGDLWFQTFPIGQPNGYDPNEINGPAYIALPGYFESQTTIDSETKDNGFMMLDADAFNSERFVMSDPPSVTDNPIEAFLISPSVDLTGVTDAAIAWNQKYRLCCVNTELNVDISFDGGENWTGVWMEDETPINSVVENTIIHNFSELLDGASNLSDVKIRFRWPYADQNGEGQTNSHYYWMIDDVYITAAPYNDLTVLEGFYNDWPMLEQGWLDGTVSDADYVRGFECDQIPDWLWEPLNFVAVVQNNGIVTQTGVGIEASVTSPNGDLSLYTTPESDRIDLAPGEIDTLTLLNQFPEGFYYNLGDHIVDIEVFQNELEYYPDDNHIERRFTISPDEYSNGYAVTDAAGASQDYIIGQRYYFGPNQIDGLITWITGIEVVLNNIGQEGFNTTEDLLLYANIRKGSVFDDDPTTVAFGDDPLLYTPIESIYETMVNEFYTGGENLVWAGFDFMTIYGDPIAIPVEPNTVYQAEMRVPAFDGDQVVSVGLQSNQEIGAVIMENPGDPEATWNTFGGYAALIRLRTILYLDPSIGTRNMTFQNGVQLFQNHPNPFSDESAFSFKLPKASRVYFEIGDMSGRVIHREGLGNLPHGVTDHRLNAVGMSAGLYTYTLITDLGRITRKMAVQ